MSFDTILTDGWTIRKVREMVTVRSVEPAVLAWFAVTVILNVSPTFPITGKKLIFP
jgi:hypothetical protein